MKAGKYSYGNPIVLYSDNKDNAKLVVGNFCSIASNVHIYQINMYVQSG